MEIGVVILEFRTIIKNFGNEINVVIIIFSMLSEFIFFGLSRRGVFNIKIIFNWRHRFFDSVGFKYVFS